MIDDLDREAAGLWLVERARGVVVQRLSGLRVDLRLQRRLQRLVGVVGAEEIGVADEAAVFVVIGVDEPAREALGTLSTGIRPRQKWNAPSRGIDLGARGTLRLGHYQCHRWFKRRRKKHWNLRLGCGPPGRQPAAIDTDPTRAGLGRCTG